MTYVDFRDSIRKELRRRPSGLTWAELRQRLKLPCGRPCPTWVKQLEDEIGLTRVKADGRALAWRLGT